MENLDVVVCRGIGVVFLLHGNASDREGRKVKVVQREGTYLVTQVIGGHGLEDEVEVGRDLRGI